MTLVLYPSELLALFVLLMLGGKFLQQGGVAYASGRPYTLEALAGLLCHLVIVVVIAVALARGVPQ